MFSYRPLARLAVVAAAWLIAAPAPAALTAEVRDNAAMFKPESVKEADQVVRAIKHDYGQDLLIETYAGIPASKKDEYEKVKDDKEKRKHFFADWARARFKEAEVNGVYILITKDPGYLQIEVGNITAQKTFTMDNRDHLEALMLKEFKAKDYDQGLIDGVNYVKSAMGDNLKRKGGAPAPAAPPPTDYPSPTTPPALWPHVGWLGWLCVGLAVLAVIWVVVAIFRAIAGRGQAYGPAGYGGPAYGGPAYGGGYGYGPGGGGGGFLSGMLGGLFGGAAGGWLYDRFFRGGGTSMGGDGGGQAPTPVAPQQPQDTDASGVGGSFDDGDNGGGGDTGGGDFGSDNGGDTGGGDTGGGDFGGDTGGGGDDSGGGSF
jgi:uncharacterized membrane protein YgcG